MNDQNFASAESSPVGDNVGRQTSNRMARWLIIAVLLLGALGLGGWLVWQYWSAAVPTLSPTTDLASPAEPSPTPPTPATPIYGSEDESGVDTSNWQTYRNEKYGFEFQYPKEWSISNEVCSQEQKFATNWCVKFVDQTGKDVMFIRSPARETSYGTAWAIEENKIKKGNKTITTFIAMDDSLNDPLGNFMLAFWPGEWVNGVYTSGEIKAEIENKDDPIITKIKQILSTFRFIE